MALTCHIEGSMIASVWTYLRMLQNITDIFRTINQHMTCIASRVWVSFMLKCWIMLKPVLRGLDGSLHLTVPSMNRLNQTESATFSILPLWTFFRVFYFSLFYTPASRCFLEWKTTLIAQCCLVPWTKCEYKIKNKNKDQQGKGNVHRSQLHTQSELCINQGRTTKSRKLKYYCKSRLHYLRFPFKMLMP
jgi:hypothetical protein